MKYSLITACLCAVALATTSCGHAYALYEEQLPCSSYERCLDDDESHVGLDQGGEMYVDGHSSRDVSLAETDGDMTYGILGVGCGSPIGAYAQIKVGPHGKRVAKKHSAEEDSFSVSRTGGLMSSVYYFNDLGLASLLLLSMLLGLYCRKTA